VSHVAVSYVDYSKVCSLLSNVLSIVQMVSWKESSGTYINIESLEVPTRITAPSELAYVVSVTHIRDADRLMNTYHHNPNDVLCNALDRSRAYNSFRTFLPLACRLTQPIDTYQQIGATHGAPTSLVLGLLLVVPSARQPDTRNWNRSSNLLEATAQFMRDVTPMAATTSQFHGSLYDC
jgi:hypothetical protein